MVTSRIPAYSLSSEFNREFRSFRITRATPRSTLYAPAIVPIHEYPRVSVHERREALKAALAKAWSSKSSEKKKHDTWTVPSEQSRAGIMTADFNGKPPRKNGDVSRVALAKHEFESKDAERTEAIDHRTDSGQPASFSYSRVNDNGLDIKETLKKGCDKGLHTKELGYSEYLSNVPKCKTSFESNFLKQNHEDRYISKRNGYDISSKRVERDVNLNNLEHSSLNGDTYDSLKYSRTANGTESVQYKHYSKAETVKSKLLSTDSLKSVSSCNGEKLNGYSGLEVRSKEQQRPLTSGPKAVVEQRLAERLEVKVAELPALYRGVDSWTPKSAAFQKNMKDHEWSVSYVPTSHANTYHVSLLTIIPFPFTLVLDYTSIFLNPPRKVCVRVQAYFLHLILNHYTIT